jgi:hypothetical protein
MKKSLAFTLALALAFSLAACSGSNDTPSQSAAPIPQSSAAPAPTPNAPPPAQGASPSSSEPAPSADSGNLPEGEAMDSLIKWMMDGAFSYDFTMTSKGPEGSTEGTGSMAIDGNNMAIEMEMTVGGQKTQTKMISTGDAMYIVDDANKMIMKMPAEINLTEGIMTDYAGITKTGEGTGEIDGKTLPYEDYTESETSAAVRFYLDGGQVYAIESEYEGYKTVMIITNPSNSAPSGAFDLPAGYTEMSM